MKAKTKPKTKVICVDATFLDGSLIEGKEYEVSENSLSTDAYKIYDVVDESGETFFYPAWRFKSADEE